MSGSSRDIRRPEYWHPGHDYWVYVPNIQNGSFPPPSGFLPAPRSLILTERMGNPWSLFEERLIRGPNNGLASLAAIPSASLCASFRRFPSVAATPSRPQIRPLLLLDYNTYPRSPNPMSDTPTYISQPGHNQMSSQNESKLTQEGQTKGMNKLRKQLYSPHLSNIVKRLGTTMSTTSDASQMDDDFKRCAICLDDFDTKQVLMVTPCNHMFHDECIVPWVMSQGKCPVCRFVIEEKNAPRVGSGNSRTTTQGGAEMEWGRFFHAF